jgi:O-antigen ligase
MGKKKNWVFKKKRLLWLLILSVIIIIGSTVILIIYQDTLIKQYHEITGKFLLDEQNVSVRVRSHVWKDAIDNWVDNPILGSGPGSSISMSEEQTGYHSVYLTLLSDTGIFSLLIFFIFILSQFNKVLRIAITHRNYLMFPLLTTVAHFAVVGDYYHAPFWILLITIQLTNRPELAEKQI